MAMAPADLSLTGPTEARGLTKRYGSRTAVDDVTFTVRPGQVTGFLGPNGAGKSTTMRMVVGLGRPTRGTVTVNGRPYAQHRSPLHEVGALLDAKGVDWGRRAPTICWPWAPLLLWEPGAWTRS